MRPRFFRSASEFRAWLEKNHASAEVMQVGFYKKHAKRAGMTYSEALDEALCYGWIDGVRHRVDDDRYTIRFTPRREKSTWSVVNTKRARELMAAGRMASPGRAAFEGRDPEKTKLYSYENRTKGLSREHERTLRRNKAAAGWFDRQPKGYRELSGFWVESAKKPETRQRRLEELIERCEQGRKIKPLEALERTRKK